MNCRFFDARFLQEQYELLRREAGDLSRYSGQSRGLSLFLTRGMKAWSEAVSCLSGRQVAPSQSDGPPVHLWVPPEATAVLANMILVCMQEAHA